MREVFDGQTRCVLKLSGIKYFLVSAVEVLIFYFIFYLQYDSRRITALADRLIKKLTDSLPDVIRNGDAEQTYPGCVNLSFAYVEGESLLMALKDVALSSGSACTSASLEPSYVLRAIGADEDLAHSSIR